MRRTADMGAAVSILEYDGQEGMMLLSEPHKRRIGSVAMGLRVGRAGRVMVLRVDMDKGYVDLTMRRVDAADATAKEMPLAQAMAVDSVRSAVDHPAVLVWTAGDERSRSEHCVEMLCVEELLVEGLCAGERVKELCLVVRAVRASRRPCCESCGAPVIPVRPSGTGQKAPVLRVLRAPVFCARGSSAVRARRHPCCVS